MSKREAPISQLQQFLPPGTYEPVLSYLQQYKVHLTIARERVSILGDYRHPVQGYNHRISVNGNLNTYSFLITLLHELGHLLTFERFGNRVASHGREWKIIYGQLLAQFLKNKTFPEDIEKVLIDSLHNPAATSCAETDLVRVLRRYDMDNSQRFVEEIPENGSFRTPDGKVFRKGMKLRKRYKCIEVKTGRVFLFSPVYEVEHLRTA